jgi:hypothetical protein
MIRLGHDSNDGAIMAGKEISVKKYVVRLSGEERERLEALLRKGKSAAQQQLKARILLKADVQASFAANSLNSRWFQRRRYIFRWIIRYLIQSDSLR